MVEMKIYVGHSTDLDYREKLYQPLKGSSLAQDQELVFPHESEEFFDSKSFLKQEADLMVAEVSKPSIGLGIEIGWAENFEVPLICLHRENVDPSSSLSAVAEKVENYEDQDEMITKLKEFSEEKLKNRG